MKRFLDLENSITDDGEENMGEDEEDSIKETNEDSLGRGEEDDYGEDEEEMSVEGYMRTQKIPNIPKLDQDGHHYPKTKR